MDLTQDDADEPPERGEAATKRRRLSSGERAEERGEAAAQDFVSLLDSDDDAVLVTQAALERGQPPAKPAAGGSRVEQAAAKREQAQAKRATLAATKAEKAATKQANAAASGKFAHREITVFVDTRLAATKAGRELGARLESLKLFHAVQQLPCAHSVLWLRHRAREEAWSGALPWAGREARVAAAREGASEGPYVLLLLDGPQLVAEAEGSGGLEALCSRVQRSHGGATLCLLSWGLGHHLRARELREFDAQRPAEGFRPRCWRSWRAW